MKRQGLGKGLGTGWKNLVPQDPFRHGLSAKGYKTNLGSLYPSNLDALYLLKPRYDGRKSFYGKATVETQPNGDVVLYSYTTKVAEIVDGQPIVHDTYSATTLRHIKDFLKQNGFKADTAKQILNDYSEKKFIESSVKKDNGEV